MNPMLNKDKYLAYFNNIFYFLYVPHIFDQNSKIIVNIKQSQEPLVSLQAITMADKEMSCSQVSTW